MNKLHTILLIDDDFTTNYLHKKIILKSEIDAPILVANNGKEGINKIIELNETVTDKNALVLIFLDLNMPVMDGWSFLENFNDMRPTLNYTTNLYILSSSINPDDENRAKSNPNVLDYFPKTLTVERMLNLKVNFI